MQMPKSEDSADSWRAWLEPKPERNAEIRRLRSDGLSYNKIGNQFDLSPECVRAICTKISKPKKETIAERDTSIVVRHLFGESDKEIADALGMKPSYVRVIYMRNRRR